MLFIQLSARQRRSLNVSIGQVIAVKWGDTTMLATVESHSDTGNDLYRYEISSTTRANFRMTQAAHVPYHVIMGGELSPVPSVIRTIGQVVNVINGSGFEIAYNRAYAQRIGSEFPAQGVRTGTVRVLDQSSREATEAIEAIRADHATRRNAVRRRQERERMERRAAMRRQRAQAERRDRRIARRTPEDIANPMPVGSWIEGEDCGDTRWYEVAGRTTQTRRSTL